MRVILLLLLFSFNQARAEWDKWESASVIRESDSILTVEADGSYVEETQSTFQVLNRQAIEANGVSVMHYKPGSEQLEFLAAATINDNETIQVNPASMEDKPLASNASGFSEINQHKFPFPSVREGYRLFRKYRIKVKHPPLAGFFFAGYSWTDATLNTSIRIVSALPLEYVVNDPNGALKIVAGREKDKYTLEIKQLKKIFHGILNEKNSSWPLTQYPWVRVSSTKSWRDFARAAGKPFEEVLSQPLPPVFDEIVKAASKETSTLSKINLALRLFSEKFRYFGDWRAVNGGLVPRSLAAIVASGYGDCKDFATSITAILRKMEISAHVAFVNRSWAVIETNTSLPLIFDFNHAIVFVDKENIWLDPTNSYRPAELISADIASRTALVLDLKNPRLETTAAETTKSNSVTLKWIFSPKSEGWEDVDIRMLFEGEPAFSQAWEILFSGKTVEKKFRLAIEGGDNASRNLRFYETTKPSVNSMMRFESHLQYERANLFYRTNLGEMSTLAHEFGTIADIAAVSPDNRVSDFQISTIRRLEHQQLYKERFASGKLPECKIRSPWIEADRNFVQTSQGLQQKDIFVTKVRRIPVADIHSPAFKRLQNEIRSCFVNVGIVFQRRIGRRT